MEIKCYNKTIWEIDTMETLLCIQMGGSLDKNYPLKIDNKGFEIDTPAFEHILPKVKPSFAYRSVTICKKDSLDITEEDIAALQQAISISTENQILITIGTDRMAYVASLIDHKDKTVVFTGAYLPVYMKETDADFAIGFAIAGTKTLKSGVYIAMNGRFLDPKKAAKNKSTLVFEEI